MSIKKPDLTDYEWMALWSFKNSKILGANTWRDYNSAMKKIKKYVEQLNCVHDLAETKLTGDALVRFHDEPIFPPMKIPEFRKCKKCGVTVRVEKEITDEELNRMNP